MSIKSSMMKGRFTSPYGLRSGFIHAGIDVAPPKAGTVGGAVYAAEDGEVLTWVTGRKHMQPASSGKVWAPGRSGNGFRYRDRSNGQHGGYNHMTPVSRLRRAGATYRAGELIGHLDTSGIQSGPHIHYERWATSAAGSHFDPVPAMRKAGIDPGDAPRKAIAPAPSTTRYPDAKVGTSVTDLKSAWYRLTGALGYKGSTTERVQEFLRRSRHYPWKPDNVWGKDTTAALQRRLREAFRKDRSGKLRDPGPDDGVRGSRTKAAESAYLNAQAWQV